MDNPLFATHVQWRLATPTAEQGFVVGCSQQQEWLLPWWWMHFRLHNEYPVTFVDFGDMSTAAKQWCQHRGELVTLHVPAEAFVATREQVLAEHAKSWQKPDFDVWSVRAAWFKKPFACLQSPYKKSVWLDLDCQVRNNLAPLFAYASGAQQIALSAEPLLIQSIHEQQGITLYGEKEYNTGVIVFQHGTPFIIEWAKMCMKSSNTVRGDQEALSKLAFLYEMNFEELDQRFNYRGNDLNEVPRMSIVHWLGGSKEHIRHEMEELQHCHFIDFSFFLTSK